MPPVAMRPRIAYRLEVVPSCGLAAPTRQRIGAAYRSVKLPRVLARATATARSITATEVELLGEPLFHQVVDRRVQRLEPPQLLTLELGKRSINTWNSSGHLRSSRMRQWAISHMSYICSQSTRTPIRTQIFCRVRAACYSACLLYTSPSPRD